METTCSRAGRFMQRTRLAAIRLIACNVLDHGNSEHRGAVSVASLLERRPSSVRTVDDAPLAGH